MDIHIRIRNLQLLLASISVSAPFFKTPIRIRIRIRQDTKFRYPNPLFLQIWMRIYMENPNLFAPLLLVVIASLIQGPIHETYYWNISRIPNQTTMIPASDKWLDF